MLAARTSEGAEIVSDKQILNRAMQGSVEISEVYRYLDASLLEDMLYKEYKPIHSAIYEYYTRHKRPPSFDILENLLNEVGDDADSLDEIKNSECEDSEIGYYIDQIKSRYNKFIIKKLSTYLSNDFEDIDDANSELKKIYSKTEKIYGSNIFSEGDLSQSTDERFNDYKFTKENPDAVKGVFSGYRELDEYTYGIKNSEMLVIGGLSSSGKSLLMLNMAINAWLGSNNPTGTPQEFDDGKNVVFFTLEMSKRQVEQRIDANLAKLDHRRLMRGKLDKEEEASWGKSLSFQKKYNKSFHIVDMPRGSKVMELEAKYESLLGSFKPDAVYVDYLNIMSPNSGKNGIDWQDVGKVAEELAEFCRNRNIPMTTAAQRKAKDMSKGGKSFKDNKIDIEDLGRSKMIGDNANIVFIIEQRSEEHLREDIPIHIVKNRDGPKGKVVLKKEFDKSRIVSFPDDWAGNLGDENEI